MAAFTKCIDVHPEQAVCASVEEFTFRHAPRDWADRAEFEDMCEQNAEAIEEHLRTQKVIKLELFKCIDVHPGRSKCTGLADFSCKHPRPANVATFQEFAKLLRENETQVLDHLNQQEQFEPAIVFTTCAEMHPSFHPVCRTVEHYRQMHKPIDASEQIAFANAVQEHNALMKHLQSQNQVKTYAEQLKKNVKFVPAEKDLIKFIFSDQKQLSDQDSEVEQVKPHLRKQRPDKAACWNGLSCVNKKCTFIHPEGHKKAKKRSTLCLISSQWPSLTK